MVNKVTTIILARYRTTSMENRCSIPGRGRKGFFFSPPRSNRVWSPSSLLSNGNPGIFPQR